MLRTLFNNFLSKSFTKKMSEHSSEINFITVTKSRRPRDMQFQQQQMHGWTPNFQASPISTLFLGSGTLMLMITILTFGLQRGILNTTVDYTDCSDFTGIECSKFLLSLNSIIQCQCKVIFQLNYDYKAPVYFYYQLENYFQNHRKFLSSRDDVQLNGKVLPTLDSDCEPIRYLKSELKYKYAPCGLVANALFNDTFKLYFHVNNKSVLVPWSNQNIAWKSDKTVVFGVPDSWANTIKPPNWNMTAVERNTNAYAGDEELIVWMKPAPLPTLKKLHRVIQKSKNPFENGLPKGKYTLSIDYAYPVTIFNGRKSIFISTTGPLGGKNYKICYLFLFISVLHFILGFGLISINRNSANTIRTFEWLLEIRVDTHSELPPR